jgi:hypothetical protein
MGHRKVGRPKGSKTKHHHKGRRKGLGSLRILATKKSRKGQVKVVHVKGQGTFRKVGHKKK